MVKATVGPSSKLTKQEKEWRAESDAHALAEAKSIMGDPTRLKAAAHAAKKMVAEKEQIVRSLKQVAKKAK